MMRLVDTSAWIEWLIASSTVVAELPSNDDWLIPTIVQMELAKWVTREVGEDRADQVIAFTETCVIVLLDMPTALAAADICARLRLTTADAIVYATAQGRGADALTCDRHFAGLSGVVHIAKSSR